MTRQRITVYCDGGCRGNGKANSIGGWGVVLGYKGKTKELWGGERNATNNTMELTAAIRALEAIKTNDIPIDMHIDSSYVVNGMTEWAFNWEKNNWRTAGGKPAANNELWIRLLELHRKQWEIKYIKVKGHVGVELNELADQLANKGMDEVERT
ncbi:ribonuclease HI [Paenibacillus sp. FSL R7-0302]|uniref:ribonuclease HI n=1 Tax=Paenibacillus sp. FSL R7-0302 TaxID=2921681 RepID=UPI0030F72999